MTTISRQTTVPYSCDQMYDLVSDIENYSHFVPRCTESVINVRDGREVRATLHFQYKGINLGLATLNLNSPPSRITMKLSEGPFKYLRGEWVFISSGDGGCKVKLRMDFDFSNRIYESIFKLTFNRLALSLLDAFVGRARAVYGRR